MARVKSGNTGPEKRVRKVLWRAGFRYRLHVRDLPGCPDIVFRKHKVAIFVHGCFWHQHEGCSRARLPATRADYWHPKLRRNVERDKQARAALIAAGWRVVVLWECELSDETVMAVAKTLRRPTLQPVADVLTRKAI